MIFRSVAFYLIFTLVLGGSAGAAETSKPWTEDLELFLHQNKEQSCEEFSDQLCRLVWSEKYKGNVRLKSGTKVLLGLSDNYLMSLKSLFNYQAFLEGACLLSGDLREVLGIKGCDKNAPEFSKTMGQLKSLLEKLNSPEVDSNEVARDAWLDALSDVDTQIGRAVKIVATQRSFRDRPHLEKKRWRNQTFEEKQVYYFHRYDLLNEILEAKYAHHSNWLRIQNIFNQAQRDLVGVVKGLSLPKDYRDRMVKQLETVALTLPYTDPRRLGAEADCATDEMNAFYDSTWHKFTVCAGYFNAVPVDGLIYHLIVHEISHSIDPQRMSLLALREQSIWRDMKKLFKSNATLSCKQWNKIKAQFRPPTALYLLPEGIREISQCLVDRSDLPELTLEAIGKQSRKDAFRSIDDLASDEWFSDLVNLKEMIDWKKVDNQRFLDPQKKVATENRIYFLKKIDQEWPNLAAAFVQEYRCQGIDAEKSSLEERKVAFEKSIREVLNLSEKFLQILYSYEGENSRDLAGVGLARAVDENWADWLANIAFTKYLEGSQNQAERREAIFANQAVYCDRDQAEDFIKGFKVVEQKFTSASHSQNRLRRLRQFTPSIAKVAGCKPITTPEAEIKICDQHLLKKSSAVGSTAQ